MTTLIFAIGLPASGKNYYYDNFLKERGYIHISSDSIREEVFGDINDQSHNDLVFNEMMNRTVKALNSNLSCYYNSTGLNQKRRIKFLNALRESVHVEFDALAIVFAIPFDTCVRRNLNRERTVPSYVMDRMYKSFQVPAYCEGWSEIHFIHDEDNKVNLGRRISELVEMPHDNHHHALTIGNHMLAAESYAVSHDFPSTVCTAALWHDIGKGSTKVFTDSKGRKTEEAHYFFHANVGAYDFITAFNATIDAIEIANLIQLHMAFYEGENRLKNIKNLYGEDFFEKLKMLHECDEAAH